MYSLLELMEITAQRAISFEIFKNSTATQRSHGDALKSLAESKPGIHVKQMDRYKRVHQNTKLSKHGSEHSSALQLPHNLLCPDERRSKNL